MMLTESLLQLDKKKIMNKYKMSRLGCLLALISIVAISCEKDEDTPLNFASFAVIHASPVAATNPSDTLNVFVDNVLYLNTGVLYLSNSGYLPVLAGDRTVDLRRGKLATSSLYVPGISNNFASGSATSFFVYDTTTSASGTARVLKLKDDLTLPVNTNSKVRFLHLAPNGAPLDVVLLRTSVMPNDSIVLSGRSYVGNSPNETTLAQFTEIPKGVYTVKLKLAGTQTLATANTSVDMSRGASVAEGGIFTLYATGTAKNRPLVLRTFRNF